MEFERILACPVDGSPLVKQEGMWVSCAGRRYEEINGIPVLFNNDATSTFPAMDNSKRIANSESYQVDPWLIDSLGMNDEQKRRVKSLKNVPTAVDPVISHMLAATCGNLYLDSVGQLDRYPIPDFRLGSGNGRLLLDVGCNWGRWCVAAARNGFVPVGIDPQIGALLAAQRMAKRLGVKAYFVCGDARYLPFQKSTFDTVFSYSVIQHFGRIDARNAVSSCHSILKPGGEIFIQMPNRFGVRCFYQLARRRFRDGKDFEVRYWTRSELTRLFDQFSKINFITDCYFGIGLQPSDIDLYPKSYQQVIWASEKLRAVENFVPCVKWFADSLYVYGLKNEELDRGSYG